MDTTEIIREYYNSTVESEWRRIENRPEFLLTRRMLDRHIKPGDSVLDIGGGPGRYSLYFAERGCDVTLLDLSPENVKFAFEKAKELKLSLKAVAGDARFCEKSVSGKFDHVLLMGPLYHLLEESGRVQAVRSALGLLKLGGTLSASFINTFAGIIYLMTEAPQLVSDPTETIFQEKYFTGKSFASDAFTKAYFANQNEILPFMSQFPLEKLHFFAQEGVLSPCEQNIMSQPPEIVELWLDFCEKTCEREELLSWGEHLMYVGRKIGE